MSWIGERWHRVRARFSRDARRLKRIQESSRDEFRPALFEDFVRDLRYGARALGRAPGFTAVATLTLALGIGANTAIFSVVNTVLLKPLSYSDPDRLVFVWERNPVIGKDRDLVAPPNYLDWKSQNVVFDALGAYRVNGFALTGAGEPESLTAITLSSSLFRVLGVRPLVGRTFTDEEEARRDRVVVLRHEFWQRRYGGDRGLVGKAITLTGTPFTVIGVMPPSFRFPEGVPADVYSPLVFGPNELAGRRTHSLTVLGRLKNDVTIDAASAHMTAIAQGIAAADKTSNPDTSVVGAHDLLVEDVRLGLLVLLGTVGFVLLIACANVANLLLVRATARRGEMAMRSTLGAGRWRLIRQLLTESMLLAVVGCALGMLVAWSVLGLLVRVSPPDLPRIDQVGIDTTVLLFVTVIALTGRCGIRRGPRAAGVERESRGCDAGEPRPPSARPFGTGRRGGGAVARAAGGRRSDDPQLPQTSGSRSRVSVRECADRADLSAGAALSDRSGTVSTHTCLAPRRSCRSRRRSMRSYSRHLAATPGMESIGAVSSLPLNPVGIDFDLPVIVQGRPRPRAGEEPQADFRFATPDYFRTMRIALTSGRLFTDFDGPDATPVAIINETMASQIFAGENPIGQRLLLYGKPREIVGVVRVGEAPRLQPRPST